MNFRGHVSSSVMTVPTHNSYFVLVHSQNGGQIKMEVKTNMEIKAKMEVKSVSSRWLISHLQFPCFSTSHTIICRVFLTIPVAYDCLLPILLISKAPQPQFRLLLQTHCFESRIHSLQFKLISPKQSLKCCSCA